MMDLNHLFKANNSCDIYINNICPAEISNPGSDEANADGLLKHWQLVLYGTEENPMEHQEGWSLARPSRPTGNSCPVVQVTVVPSFR